MFSKHPISKPSIATNVNTQNNITTPQAIVCGSAMQFHNYEEVANSHASKYCQEEKEKFDKNINRIIISHMIPLRIQ